MMAATARQSCTLPELSIHRALTERRYGYEHECLLYVDQQFLQVTMGFANAASARAAALRWSSSWGFDPVGAAAVSRGFPDGP